MIDKVELRYLIAGGWNTFFGYIITVGLYYWLTGYVNTLLILGIAHFLAITMSFWTYKLFVFKSRGHWWPEYLKSYLVYGNVAVSGIFLTWVLVDYIFIPFWVAQAFVLILSVIVSFVGHRKFTFSNKKYNTIKEDISEINS